MAFWCLFGCLSVHSGSHVGEWALCGVGEVRQGRVATCNAYLWRSAGVVLLPCSLREEGDQDL